MTKYVTGGDENNGPVFMVFTYAVSTHLKIENTKKVRGLGSGSTYTFTKIETYDETTL